MNNRKKISILFNVVLILFSCINSMAQKGIDSMSLDIELWIDSAYVEQPERLIENLNYVEVSIDFQSSYYDWSNDECIECSEIQHRFIQSMKFKNIDTLFISSFIYKFDLNVLLNQCENVKNIAILMRGEINNSSELSFSGNVNNNGKIYLNSFSINLALNKLDYYNIRELDVFSTYKKDITFTGKSERINFFDYSVSLPENSKRIPFRVRKRFKNLKKEIGNGKWE